MIDITVRHQLGSHIVSLSGVADAELLAMLLETVRQLAVEDGPVVVDLSEVTLVAPDALRATLVGLAAVPTLRVVSRRDTALRHPAPVRTGRRHALRERRRRAR